MIEVEIRTPTYNEESQAIEWERLALVRADDGEITVYGDESVLFEGPVMGIASGRPVEPDEAPDEWVRSLPYAYRSGDLVAVVLHDDAPPALDNAELEPEPEIPEPPAPQLEHDVSLSH